MVCDISKDKVVTVMNREEGIVMYQAKEMHPKKEENLYL